MADDFKLPELFLGYGVRTLADIETFIQKVKEDVNKREENNEPILYAELCTLIDKRAGKL